MIELEASLFRNGICRLVGCSPDSQEKDGHCANGGSWLQVFLLIIFLGLAGQTFGAHYSLRLGAIPDPAEALNQTEIDALEATARAGDWGLKQQFAAAYLYEHLKLEYWDWGCRHLPHGHVCRAMATRTESGQRFLREIIDQNKDGPVDKITLARFQADFANRRMFDARPEFAPQHPACQEAVRYYERAIENERTNWQSCTPARMFEMAWHGQCMPVSREKAAEYAKLARGCAQY